MINVQGTISLSNSNSTTIYWKLLLHEVPFWIFHIPHSLKHLLQLGDVVIYPHYTKKEAETIEIDLSSWKSGSKSRTSPSIW